MTIKKFLMLILAISFFAFPGNSIERKKPLPLKELQNPEGPSFVPIPYPQTNKDVIIDLKYFFKKLLKMKGSCSDTAYEKTIKGFLEEKNVIVGEILRIKNKLVLRQRDYIFFIRLKTKANIWVANICLNSDGLFLASNYLDIDVDNLKSNSVVRQRNIYKPYLDKIAIADQLKETLGYELDNNKIKSMQLVEGQSRIANPLHPACEIVLENGSVFYYTFNPKAIYSAECSLFQKSGNYLKDLRENLIEKRDAEFIIKSEEDKVLILKKLWREK